MIKSLKATGLALGIALVSITAPIPAGAQDMELRIGPDGVRPVIRDRAGTWTAAARPACAAAANAKPAPPPVRPACATRKSCA